MPRTTAACSPPSMTLGSRHPKRSSRWSRRCGGWPNAAARGTGWGAPAVGPYADSSEPRPSSRSRWRAPPNGPAARTRWHGAGEKFSSAAGSSWPHSAVGWQPAISLDDLVGVAVLSAVHDGQIDLAIAIVVELEQVSLAVSVGVDDPQVGLAVVVRVRGDQLVPLGTAGVRGLGAVVHALPFCLEGPSVRSWALLLEAGRLVQADRYGR